MKAGKITSLELVDVYLARIAAYADAGPALKALISVNPAARDEAAALDAERAGPRADRSWAGSFECPTAEFDNPRNQGHMRRS